MPPAKICSIKEDNQKRNANLETLEVLRGGNISFRALFVDVFHKRKGYRLNRVNQLSYQKWLNSNFWTSNKYKQNFTATEFICLLNETHAPTDRVDKQCKYSYSSRYIESEYLQNAFPTFKTCPILGNIVQHTNNIKDCFRNLCEFKPC